MVKWQNNAPQVGGFVFCFFFKNQKHRECTRRKSDSSPAESHSGQPPESPSRHILCTYKHMTVVLSAHTYKAHMLCWKKKKKANENMPYILFSPKGITVRTGKCPTSFHFISSLGRTFRWFLLLAVFYSDFTEWKEISKGEQQSPHIRVFPVRSSILALKSAFVLWWMQSCPCDGPWLGARSAARWRLSRLRPTWTSKGNRVKEVPGVWERLCSRTRSPRGMPSAPTLHGVPVSSTF